MEAKINSSIKAIQKFSSLIGHYSVKSNQDRIRFFMDKNTGRVKAIGKIPNITKDLEEIEREEDIKIVDRQ